MRIAVQRVDIVVVVLIDNETHTITLSGRTPAREFNRKLLSRGVSRGDRALLTLAAGEEIGKHRRDVYRQFLHVASSLSLTSQEVCCSCCK